MPFLSLRKPLNRNNPLKKAVRRKESVLLCLKKSQPSCQLSKTETFDFESTEWSTICHSSSPCHPCKSAECKAGAKTLGKCPPKTSLQKTWLTHFFCVLLGTLHFPLQLLGLYLFHWVLQLVHWYLIFTLQQPKTEKENSTPHDCKG